MPVLLLMSIAAVINFDPSHRVAADLLAERCGLKVVDGSALVSAKARERMRFVSESLDQESGFVFFYGADGLCLHAFGELNLSIRADFHGPSVRYRRVKGGGRGQLIAKAVGFKGDDAPRVLDCTAGLGGDAFVLASLGCEVTILERVPAVRELLRDGLAQARQQMDQGLNSILDRMQLIESDALAYMRETRDVDRPDVVYLDPMFPERTKSALVKKEMRVFHDLVGDDPDADALLPAALRIARKRVVVKRPRIAPTLASTKPSHVLEGKRNRYDIYVGCGSNAEH